MINRRIDYSVLVSKDLWNRSDSLLAYTRTHAYTHTHTLSLSLSLPLSFYSDLIERWGPAVSASSFCTNNPLN